ncbi:MAG: hypothetical protein JST68_27270 [Bacteroidetes bacterium]|nr:hypothetical protein [Bacteroidota bacterium]
MKKILMFGSVLFVAVVYLSWRNPGGPGPKPPTASTSATAAAGATSAPDAPTGNGQPVTRAQYQPCLDSFVSVMARYGITSNIPPVKNTACPAMTYPITTSESFQASGLMAWMQGVIDTYDPDGKGANLDFQMKFGICTPNFVKSTSQAASLVGRIAVFIVPAYRTTDAAKAAKAKVSKTRGVTGTDPGGGGYELGGLQP